MKSLNVLGMDYGASNGRGVAGKFDGEKLTLNVVHRFSNESVPVFSNIYWDILFLHNQAIESIKKSRSVCDSLSSMAIDSWALDFGIINREGNLVGGVHAYRDPRTGNMLDEGRKEYSDFEIFQRTGIPPMNIATLYQLMAMKQQEKDFLEGAYKLLFVPNLLAYLLTGSCSCDSTIASTSLLYSPFQNKWSEDIAKVYDIPGILPDIVRHGEVIGKIHNSLALQADIDRIPVVSIAHHDTASAFSCVPATNREEVVYISCGTWSIIGSSVKEPIVNKRAYENMFCNEIGLNNEIMFVKNLTGLFILQECVREWKLEGFEMDYGHFEESARKSNFDTYIDVSSTEFMTPGRMNEKVVEHCRKFGKKPPETKEEVYKSITLGLALKYKETIDILEQLTGKEYRKIHTIGGGSRDTYLCETLCRLTGMEVVAGPYEATVTGNIFAQLMALGEVNDTSEVVDIIKRSFNLDFYN